MNRLLELSVLDGLIRYMRELARITIRMMTLRNSPMTATGTAMVSAASVEAPERIANAVA